MHCAAQLTTVFSPLVKLHLVNVTLLLWDLFVLPKLVTLHLSKGWRALHQVWLLQDFRELRVDFLSAEGLNHMPP